MDFTSRSQQENYRKIPVSRVVRFRKDKIKTISIHDDIPVVDLDLELPFPRNDKIKTDNDNLQRDLDEKLIDIQKDLQMNRRLCCRGCDQCVRLRIWILMCIAENMEVPKDIVWCISTLLSGLLKVQKLS